LKTNVADLAEVSLRQRVLMKVSDLSLATEWFGHPSALPVIIARRGAAKKKGVPFVLSTVSVCSLEEVTSQCPRPIWFQLYVIKDRGFMRNALERAQSLGVNTLVFTVDAPVSGSRYRDAHSGMSGPFAIQRRILQAMMKPAWAFDVWLMGRPHDLGNVSKYLGKGTGLKDYMGWLGENIDPSISWSDLEWIRDFWNGPMIVKGLLDLEDARDAVRFGANGIVVSNHGGRQLDGVLSTAKALPAIAEAVGNDLVVFVDSGVRSGLDVVRMLALGAKGVMLGRAPVFALAANGQAGVENMLEIFANEMRVAMTLTGVTSVARIDGTILA
jgi:L-lactate dehydrogenase (cytochrome)